MGSGVPLSICLATRSIFIGWGSESSKELRPLSRLSQGFVPKQVAGSKDMPVLNRSRSNRVQFSGDRLKALLPLGRESASINGALGCPVAYFGVRRAAQTD